ncbi:APC family permease [Streptomyces sp. JJ38]|uniref:APC family permease n=1 Tax=Streptomyces sp. JJ38 TaxID=2738128 RepID=UPI001C573445|nr:APC family permease [Streptomyces sp. JJ38]MBW1596875.1 amino acid permease [Streptomyces sp. JJ38]
MSTKPSQKIGYREATALGVGGIVGAGIFVLSGTASGLAGPAVVLAFGIAFGASLILSLCYAELSSMHDDSGGPYAYAKRHLPPSVATVVGWSNWGAWMCASSYVGIGVGSYLHLLVPALSQPVASALVIAVFTGLNLLGIRFSGTVQFVALILTVIVLLSFIAVGAAHVDTANYTPFMPHGMSGVMQAALIGFLALTGWDAIVVSAEEIERPRRTIPLSVLTSLGISFILYAGLLLIENGIIPWDELGASKTPVVDVSRAFFGSQGPFIVNCIVLIALLAAVNANLIVISRASMVLARDRLAPALLNRTVSSKQVPVIAIVCAGLAQTLMSIAGNLRFAVSATGFLYTLTFITSILALFRARRRGVLASFKVPFYPLTPALALLLCLVFITSAGVAGVVTGVGWIAVALCYTRWRRRRELDEQMCLLGPEPGPGPAAPTDVLSRSAGEEKSV